MNDKIRRIVFFAVLCIMLSTTAYSALAYHMTSRIKVTGDSSPLQWSPYPAGAHYLRIDDFPANDDFDYISTTRSNYYDWWSLANWGSWIPQPENENIHIYSLRIYERAKATRLTFPTMPSFSILHNMPNPSLPSLYPLSIFYADYYRTVYCIGTLFDCRPITIQNITDLEIGIRSNIPLRNTIRMTNVFVIIEWDYVVVCNGVEDCVIDCSNNPVVLHDVDVGGYNITFSGDGTVTFKQDTSINNWNWLLVENGCEIQAIGNNSLRSI